MTTDRAGMWRPELRKVIYTTNMIESISYQLRKISKTVRTGLTTSR